jgi:hypothetical protein
MYYDTGHPEVTQNDSSPAPLHTTKLAHTFTFASRHRTGACLVGIALYRDAGTSIIINGNGCQVTEEDAVGIFLQSNLYLRIDFPDSHWRFGLRNDGLKGLSLVDVSLQAGQFTSKQYMIKHAGMADIFVPYDDGTCSPYDMRGSYNNMDQMDAADLPANSEAWFTCGRRRATITSAIRIPKWPWSAARPPREEPATPSSRHYARGRSGVEGQRS